MNNNNTEIERKFLVDSPPLENLESLSIQQGYLSNDKDKVIRIRTSSTKGFITIKGSGMITHKEFEYEIPLDDAIEMLNSYCDDKLSKERYLYPTEKHTWEIDIFKGDNEGLIIAEIELDSEDEVFDKPDWVREEVTGKKKYYNSNLIKKPYKNWKNDK